MHNSLTPTTRRLLQGLTAIAALTAMNAFAVDARYWDTATTAGLQGGDGTWNTGANWSGSAAGSDPLVSWLDNSDVYFQTPGTTNNVTLSGTVPAGLLDLSGSGTVVNLSGGTLQLAAGATVNSGCTLQIGAGGATGSLDTASISNAGTLLLNRTGEASYAGSISGTGALRNIGGGTFTLTGVMGTSGAPIGQVILKQGTTVIDTGGQLYTNTDFYVGLSGGDNATLTLKGNAKLDTSNAGTGGDRICIGDGSSTGILNVQDTAAITTGFDRYLRISPTGTIHISGGSLYSWRSHLNGGTISVSDSGSYTGPSGDGDFIAGGGVVINVSGGTFQGQNVAAYGNSTFNISGGIANLSGAGHFGGNLGWEGIGSGGTPTFNVTGGTLNFNFAGNIIVRGSPSIFILGGTGVLQTGNWSLPGTPGLVTFHFDGGTWQPAANSMPATVALNVKLGGAKIENNGTLAITAPLEHDSTLGITPDGGLTKSGAGMLTLSGSNTYTGPTRVLAGTLACTTTASLTQTALEIEDVAFVNLGYAGTQSIPSLKIAGSVKSPGVYGAVGSAPPVIEDSHLTGTGTLTVAGGSSPFQTWVSQEKFNVPPGKQGKADDPDGDGHNNLIEFALDGNPSNGADNGKVYSFTGVSGDYPGKVLILTIAVRVGTDGFTGSPAVASNAADGIQYTVMGGIDLNDWTGVIYCPTDPITTGDMPATPGEGYEYRSFILDSSNGLPGKGFLRVKVEPTVP